MATIKEIAKKAGVSAGTVDRVVHNRGEVSEETKAKVLKIIEELNFQPNAVARALAVSKKNFKILFILVEHERHVFFKDVYEAACDKAKELEEYGVSVTIMELSAHFEDWYIPEQELAEYDGIIVGKFNTEPILRVVNYAISNNIPIVYYNRGEGSEECLAYVGPDYYRAGQIAAGLSTLLAGNDAQICIYSEFYDDISGVPLNKKSRILGFKRELCENYPQARVVEEKLILESYEENKQSVKDLLKKYPDISVIYIDNPNDYSICKAIHEVDKEKKIKIVTHDLVGHQRQMIKDGIISATIGQEPDVQGALSLDILYKYLAFGEVPEEKDFYTKQNIFIAQNI